MPLRFDWDLNKAASSVAKHGVTFDEASTVFGDQLAVIFDDEDHSQPDESEKTMKKAPARNAARASSVQLRDEYRFDYSKARPNRFAARVDQTRLVVALDADVSEVFTTPESVNKALRALIDAIPTRTTSPNKALNGSRRKRKA